MSSSSRTVVPRSSSNTNVPLNTALLGETASDSIGIALGAGEPLESLKPKASFASVTFVLLNTCLGSGILGLPGAFAKSGLIGGIVLLFVTGILSTFGVHLLAEAADRAGRPASFYSVALAAAGSKAGVLIDVLVAINAFGVATSYLIVVGDVLPEVADSFSAPAILRERTVWMLIALAIGAPLSFLRNLSALRHTAYAAFVCVLYISIVVGLFAIAPQTFHPCASAGGDATNTTNTTSLSLDNGDWTTSLPIFSPDEVAAAAADATCLCNGSLPLIRPDNTTESCSVSPLGQLESTLDSLPIFIFAYTCHQNAISITNEFVRPTPRRIVGATAAGIVLGLVLYLLVGIGGYLTYGDQVESDILKSFPEGSTLPVIARLAVAFVVTTCYPMQINPGRNSLVSIITTFCPPGLVQRLGGAQGTPLHILATSLLVAGSIGVALVVSSLGKMLSVIGAICSTSVTFIVPGGCYVVLYREGGWRLKRLFALGQLVLGIIIAPLCLVLTFLPQKAG